MQSTYQAVHIQVLGHRKLVVHNWVAERHMLHQQYQHINLGYAVWYS